MKEALFGKTLVDLTEITTGLGLPSYAGKQLAEWIYRKEVDGFDGMTNLSRKARELLDSAYELGFREPVEVQESVDGTRKYLFPATSDGARRITGLVCTFLARCAKRLFLEHPIGWRDTCGRSDHAGFRPYTKVGARG